MSGMFRRLGRRFREDRTERLIDNFERAGELRLVSEREGLSNLKHVRAVAELVEATAKLPNAVVKAGSLLYIKRTVNGEESVFAETLTASQLRQFEEHRQFFSDPVDALRHIQLLRTNTDADELPPSS